MSSPGLPKIQFRLLLIKYRSFLKTLYAGHNSRASIKRASTEELNIIGRICHFICNGTISMYDKSDLSILRQKRSFRWKTLFGLIS